MGVRQRLVAALHNDLRECPARAITSGAENLSSRCPLEAAPYGLNRTAGAGMRGAQPNLAASACAGMQCNQQPRIGRIPLALIAVSHVAAVPSALRLSHLATQAFTLRKPSARQDAWHFD